MFCGFFIPAYKMAFMVKKRSFQVEKVREGKSIVINHLPLKHSLMVNPLGVQSTVAMVLVEVYQVKVEVVVTQ